VHGGGRNEVGWVHWHGLGVDDCQRICSCVSGAGRCACRSGADRSPSRAAPAGPAGQDLNFATPKPADANSGTEVRIPGLGKLGVLPKMDFGLELLYGANDSKQQPEAQQPAEDLTIRGSLKHNF
jgi:hypothetical protein